MIINANQGGGGNLQPTVTVTPSTSTQPIKPDPPYNGLSEVIVNPAPLEVATVKSSTTQQSPITPTAPNIGFSSITVEPNLLQTKAVTLPTSQPIQPDSGYYGLSGVNVSAPLYSYGTITPSASSRYLNIPSGNYGLDALTVAAAPLTTLNVTPTNSPQSFTPTNPYIGYSSVTVGAAGTYKAVRYQNVGGSGSQNLYLYNVFSDFQSLGTINTVNIQMMSTDYNMDNLDQYAVIIANYTSGGNNYACLLAEANYTCNPLDMVRLSTENNILIVSIRQSNAYWAAGPQWGYDVTIFGY